MMASLSRITICLALLLGFSPVARSQVFSEQTAAFAEAIRSGDTEEKRTALFELRNIGTAEASIAALPALKDNDVMVRATAAGTVVYLASIDAVQALLPLLSDRDAFVRREAALALRTVKDSSATGALLNSLRREKDAEVRTAAVIALGEIADTDAIAPLTNILRSKPSETEEMLRRSAARSIGQIAFFVRTGRHYRSTPQNFLPERFKEHINNDVVDHGADSAKLLSALPVLMRTLNSTEESADCRREAAFALGAIGDAGSVKILQSNLNSSDPYLAEICKEALLMLENHIRGT